jgi:hypothetical protein
VDQSLGVLTVADEDGIAPEHRERIFDRLPDTSIP